MPRFFETCEPVLVLYGVCYCVQVERSVALLKSLGGERGRWEQGSETFKNQMATIIGDVLLMSAFMTYAGTTTGTSSVITNSINIATAICLHISGLCPERIINLMNIKSTLRLH